MTAITRAHVEIAERLVAEGQQTGSAEWLTLQVAKEIAIAEDRGRSEVRVELSRLREEDGEWRFDS